MDRRQFIGTAAAAGVGMGVAAVPDTVRGLDAPNDTIVVAVVGTGGRGTSLAESFAQLPGAEVAYVSDVDERRMQEAAAAVSEIQESKPQQETDFRRVLEDNAVDAVVVATPDHWHAPASILAMSAGKHVYVEKPCSHSPREGELLIEAANKYNRVVQMGNQRRSWPNVIDGMQALQEGVIGRVYFSRGWYANSRGPIGHGKVTEVPDWLDYELWQGPAPREPYRDNILHYNWHWFWNWGTGEAGNNGVHALDLCRWGLGVDYPVRVSSTGGRYHWEDDWETPDTQVITLDFEGEKTIAWEGRSCNARPIEGSGFGASFHGEEGTMVITGNSYILYNNENEKIREVTGSGDEQDIDVTGPGFDIDYDHLKDFTDGIRNSTRTNAHIEGGHKSTLLCQLGVIAYKTGDTLACNPNNGHILNSREAMKNHWSREYEPGWEPTV
jgi:predicted dehydrogenase